MGILAYLDICIGHTDQYALAQASYDATVSLLTKNAAIYGLPSSPSALSEEQQEILKELDVLFLLLRPICFPSLRLSNFLPWQHCDAGLELT